MKQEITFWFKKLILVKRRQIKARELFRTIKKGGRHE